MVVLRTINIPAVISRRQVGERKDFLDDMMDERPFTCPFCETEIQLPEDAWYFTCPSCGHRLDISSQFAFLRGLDAFSEGQNIIEKVSPRKRRTPFYPLDQQAIELFQEAYSALQVAFQAELAEKQRTLAIEMMSSMSGEFMKRNMISMLEMNYWNTLMVELTAQYEYDSLKEKLAGEKTPLGFIGRYRWRSRQKKLLASLAEIEKRIAAFEREIQFTEVPKVRNKRWKP